MSKDINVKKNWFANHKILTVILVIIVLGIIGSASGGNKSITVSPAGTGTVATEKTEFNVGEAITTDNRTLTVNSVERNYSTGNQFAQPESGNEFVVVSVTIVNNSKDSMSYNSFDFKLQDSSGVQKTESFMALSDGKLNSGSLAAGGKVTGKLAYEVPAGDAGLKLLFSNISLFSNKTITVNL